MTASADPVALPDLGRDAAADAADEVADEAAALPRRAWVRHHMAMPWSIHVRGPGTAPARTAAVVDRAFALVAHLDAELSPFRSGSALSRYRAGSADLAASPALTEVHRLCVLARERTDGAFDAWGWRDGFDPTGLTKGWALDRVLEVLAEVDGDVAVGAGGDVAVRSTSGLPWRVGVEDPADRSRLAGWVDVRDGAVATSGPAARGAHIVDPRTGEPASGVVSATVVAETAVRADVWATAAVVLGDGAAARLRTVPGTAGLLLLADGAVHRWAV